MFEQLILVILPVAGTALICWGTLVTYSDDFFSYWYRARDFTIMPLLFIKIICFIIAVSFSFSGWRKYSDRDFLVLFVAGVVGLVVTIWNYVAESMLNLSGFAFLVSNVGALIADVALLIIFIMIAIKRK